MAGRIEVETGKSYPVVIGDGLELGTTVSENVEPGSCAILTDSNAGPLYLNTVRSGLKSAGWTVVETLEIPAGEASKSLGAYADILRSLARAGLARDSTLFALGGGVVGDLGGFVAASYMRGIKLVMLPTTLLAMVDSSVGGKTGVDLPEGKNLVGAFLQPEIVACDLDFLATLPEEQISNGLAEVIKMGLLAGGDFFEDLAGVEKALDGNAGVLERLVTHAVRYKAEVVAGDERESGVRAVLNYGHTIGHALEAVSGYGVSHGEAIAAGMRAAARIAEKKLGADLVGLHEELLSRAKLPTKIPDFEPDEIVAAMGRDKKRRSKDGDHHRFVLLEEPGRPKWGVCVSDTEVREVLARD
ncbi:MAG: 3-dehydroquinate synthase [Rubrobacteraceae bacterium]